MNQYTITNARTQQTFQVQDTAWPPAIGLQPEWGQPARTKDLSQCDVFEASRATNQRPDPSDPTGVEQLVDLPDDFTYTAVNIDAQLAAAATVATANQTRMTRLQGYAAATEFPSLTTAQQQFLQDILDQLLGR